MFNKKHKKEQNIQQNVNKFVESIDNTIQNYKNNNNIDNIYTEKIVKSIIKTIFFTKEYVDLQDNKYYVDNSYFLTLNKKGILTIIDETNKFVNNNTKDDIIEFIKHINSKDFKIHLICIDAFAVGEKNYKIVPTKMNMKNIFDNKDNCFESVIQSVDFLLYKHIEFPKDLIIKPYKCYLEHLIESNKPTINETFIINDNVMHTWYNTDITPVFLHDFRFDIYKKYPKYPYL